VQAIDKTNQFSVLLINFSNPYAEPRIPFQECHTNTSVLGFVRITPLKNPAACDGDENRSILTKDDV
jgi:hypothetical protein